MVRRRSIVLAMLAVLVASACGSSAEEPAASEAPTSSTAVPSDPDELTTYEAFEVRVAEAELLTPELAIEGLGLAFGPIEGLTDQTRDASVTPMRGHLLDRVEQVWDDLDESQQGAVVTLMEGVLDTAAFHRRLGPDADAFDDVDGELVTGAGLRGTVAPLATIGLPRAAAEGDSEERAIRDAIEPLILQARRELSANMGYTYDQDIDLVILTTDRVDDGAFGASSDRDGPLGLALVDCTLYFGRFLSGKPANVLRSLVYHEVFHCIQRRMSPGTRRPTWIVEGSAAWVGENAGGGAPVISSAWWRNYLGVSGYAPSIDADGYTAIGIFAHAFDRVGMDPWPALRRVFTAGDILGDEEYLSKIVSEDADGFYATWGPSRMREPGWGAAWDTTGPAIGARELSPLQLLTGFRGSLPAVGTTLFTPDDIGRTEVVIIEGIAEGAMRWEPDGEEVAVSGAFREAWCGEDGCECPDGGEPSIPDLRPAPSGSVLHVGVAARDRGASVQEERIDIEDLCTPCDDAPVESGVIGGDGDAPAPDAPAPEASSCEDPGEGDPSEGGTAACPDGAWKLDLGSYRNILVGLLGPATEGGGSIQDVGVTGEVRADYADGVLEVVYDNLRVVTAVGNDDFRVPLVMVMNGAGQGTYSVRGSTLSAVADNFAMSVDLEVGGEAVDAPLDLTTADLPGGGFGDAELICGPGQMVHQIAIPDGTTLTSLWRPRSDG